VAVEGLESVPPRRSGHTGSEPFAESSAVERAVYALERGIEQGQGLVVLDGPEGAGKSCGLRELVRRLRGGGFQVVRVVGDALAPEALGLRVLAALGSPESRDPQRDVVLRAEDLRAHGRPLVLLVDDGEALPVETVRWLALLAEPPSTLARVVLAAREYAVFLDALTGLGTCVDLVRLDPEAAPVAARGGELPGEPEPGPPTPSEESAFASSPEPPQPLEPSPIGDFVFEPVEQPTLTALPSESPTAESQRERLLTVEELLGDEEIPVLFELPPEPDPVAGASAGSVQRGESRVAVEVLDAEPAPRAVESPPSPTSKPAPAPGPVRRVPSQPAPPALAPTTRSGWRQGSNVVRWLVAAFAVAVAVAWLAAPAIRGRPAPAVSPAASPRPAPNRGEPASVTTSRAARSELETVAPAAGSPRQPRSAGALVVSDLRQAFDLLAEEPGGDSHAAAVRFLREHGPDSEGYALLDELDARRPRQPEEAVKILRARSRVRAALCASWADDSRGEAAARLGCPGTESASR